MVKNIQLVYIFFLFLPMWHNRTHWKRGHNHPIVLHETSKMHTALNNSWTVFFIQNSFYFRRRIPNNQKQIYHHWGTTISYKIILAKLAEPKFTSKNSKNALLFTCTIVLEAIPSTLYFFNLSNNPSPFWLFVITLLYSKNKVTYFPLSWL